MRSLKRPESDAHPLSETEAEIYVASVCFKTGPPGPAGIEIEKILHDVSDPAIAVPVERVREAVAAAGVSLPGQGTITFEPGGQVELSSACMPDLPGLISSVREDLAVLELLLLERGLRFSDRALDTVRAPRRTLEHPRYSAMQHHFDLSGTTGKTMMCSTASLQISLEAGLSGSGSDGVLTRWRRLHSLLPVLVAMFANSPAHDGELKGWKSARQQIWLDTDPSRTAPVPRSADPSQDWARYALDALVLCIPGDSPRWDAPPGLRMRDWLRGEGPRPVVQADLDYHLTTLFPPVRPRGFLEVRVIDAQPGGDWEVPASVVAALVDDSQGADRAAEACEGLRPLQASMCVAARDGLTHPALARAAAACAGAAVEALARTGADAATRSRVESFVERYTARGRSPADDVFEDGRLPEKGVPHGNRLFRQEKQDG